MNIEGQEVEIKADLQNPGWRVTINGKFAFHSCTNKRTLISQLPMIIKKMKKEKQVKARVNSEGLMGSASREHKVKKGKGSFERNPKHKKPLDR